MNAAASSKAKPLSLLCSPEKYSPSCFLNAVLYKLLKHALRYIASWTILSPFLSFVSSKEFSYKFAHLHILWSSLKDCDRYNDSQWLMFRYKKNVRSTSLEDFDVWRETAKRQKRVENQYSEFYYWPNQNLETLRSFHARTQRWQTRWFYKRKYKYLYPQKSHALQKN